MRKLGLFALLLGLGMTVGCEPAKKSEPAAPATPPVTEGETNTEETPAAPTEEGADAAPAGEEAKAE